MADVRTTRYLDDEVVLAGVAGVNLEIPSANPRNHHDVIAVTWAPPSWSMGSCSFHLPTGRCRPSYGL